MFGVAAFTTALVSAASAETSGQAATKVKGGTYRVGWESSFGWTDSFDPTGEYLANGFAIYGNLLLRTLVSFNHVAGPAGNIPVPDLATSIPKPTNGGKRYTFKLKKGIKFGPPVNREITSKDVKYAIERLARPKNGAQYAFYFNVIQGLTEYSKGERKSISGIKTPSAKTIVFNLTQPAGDFPFRVSMPAAAPIPQEVAKCFEGKPGGYGRFVIASGPYMIDGSQSRCCAGSHGTARVGFSEARDYPSHAGSRGSSLAPTLLLQLLYAMVVIIGDCHGEWHRSRHSDLG